MKIAWWDSPACIDWRKLRLFEAGRKGVAVSIRHAHHGRFVGVLAAVVALAALAVTVPARSSTTDTVIDWNLNAANALSNAPTATPPGVGMTPPVTEVHLAMVEGAVYDAVNAIDLANGPGHQPYLSGLPAASASDSVNAAAATAAHNVLIGVLNALPSPQPPVLPAVLAWVEAAYTNTLAAIPDSAAKIGGIADGAAAASAMLALRAHDGRYGPFRFTPGTEAGQWRPELPAFVSDPNAWVAKVVPFLMDSQSQFRSDGPPLPLKSGAYAGEFNEVKDLGALNGSRRTSEQTALGLFYTDHAVAMWNRTFRAIAQQQGLSESDEARLFGMLNLAGADSLIGCWDSKAYWSFWRPITAIRQADADGNPATTADPNWLPLVATPPYPDEPSGFNCVTSGFMHTAEDFFGTDKMAFTVHSNATNANRDYTRFSDTWKDTIDARIYIGIHFRTADVNGVVLGKKVSHWLDKHYFQPVG
jgi:hypothetical protein